MDNIFDTVHNFQKLAWKFTEKHEEEIGLWQFIGAKIAKSGNFANKVSHITSLKEIDKNIRRLEWLIRKREKLHNAKFENEVNGATTPTPPPTP